MHVVALGRRRLVGGRRAAHGGGDVGVDAARRPSSARDRLGLVREAACGCSDANRKSPDRSPVNTRPGAVAAVRGGREPDDQQPGARIAEAGDRPAPVRPRRGTRRASPGRPASRHVDEARARAALDDLASVSAAQIAGRHGVRSYGRRADTLRAVRVLLLVNATASSVTPRKRVMIRKLLAAEHEVEVAETSRRGHATRLARAAANDGFDVVVVLAGDGTLNEAADGLLHTDTALAPLPGRLDQRLRAHARVLDRRDRRHQRAAPRRSDAARPSASASAAPNRRPFLFNTGIGFDAAVIRRVERYGELKRLPLPPAARRRRVRGLLPQGGHAHPTSTSSSTRAS